MDLYGDAFSPGSGRCFRLIYEEATTRPMHCPAEVITRGWFRDRRGIWWAVDSCAEHSQSLSSTRPGPGARIGTVALTGRGGDRRGSPAAA